MQELIKVKELLVKNQTSRILAENIVIEYNNYFYKCPNFSGKFLFYKGVDSFDFINKSYDLLKLNFGNHYKIVETEIYNDEKLGYVIKQKKINGRALVKKDLKNKKVREKIIKLLKINKTLWEKEGFFLDILGTDALFKPLTFHNLFISGEEIFIFDFGLLNKNATSKVFRLFSYIFYYLQNMWIKYFLLK